MSGKTIRWGIVGCGAVTEVKSGPAYQRAAGFSLDAVMRRSADKARDYAWRHNVPRWYSDAGELIQDTNIDAVYIATPPDSHCALALEVAAAGKPCCVEKPMANSVAECEAMLRAFEAAGQPLFVAYYRRSLPRFQQIAHWLQAGRIGAVRHVSWRLCKPPGDIDLSGEGWWRTDPELAPGGYFDDLGSHGLDLFDFLLGPIRTAQGVSGNQQGLYGAVDAVAASWIHETGVTGIGSWHFGVAAREDEVVVYGSAGQIRFSVFDDAPVELESPDGAEAIVIENPATVQLPHVQRLADALLGDSLHPSSGVSALRTARVMADILAVG